MTFVRFLDEFKVKPELQTFLDRYSRRSLFVSLLGLTMLFITLPAQGQGGRTQTTPEQVNQAVRETQRLCADQTEKGAIPGLAVAVVFQDQVVYTAGFGVRDVNRDLFTCDNPEGETGGVTFTIGADGKATAVVVEELNLHGDGTFKRRSVENK